MGTRSKRRLLSCFRSKFNLVIFQTRYKYYSALLSSLLKVPKTSLPLFIRLTTLKCFPFDFSIIERLVFLVTILQRFLYRLFFAICIDVDNIRVFEYQFDFVFHGVAPLISPVLATVALVRTVGRLYWDGPTYLPTPVSFCSRANPRSHHGLSGGSCRAVLP